MAAAAEVEVAEAAAAEAEEAEPGSLPARKKALAARRAKLEAEKAQTKVEALRGESGEAAPADELTALSASELRQRCDALGIDTAGMEKHELVNALRAAAAADEQKSSDARVAAAEAAERRMRRGSE